jgi:hypothetical protein
VFPNPVQQGGELSVPAMNGGGEVQLFDAAGRLLRSITLREGQRSIQLDGTETPGSYLLVARGERPWRARVVVQ